MSLSPIREWHQTLPYPDLQYPLSDRWASNTDRQSCLLDTMRNLQSPQPDRRASNAIVPLVSPVVQISCSLLNRIDGPATTTCACTTTRQVSLAVSSTGST